MRVGAQCLRNAQGALSADGEAVADRETAEELSDGTFFVDDRAVGGVAEQWVRPSSRPKSFKPASYRSSPLRRASAPLTPK